MLFDTSEVEPAEFSDALDENNVLRIALATGAQVFLLAGGHAPNALPYLAGHDALTTVVCLPRYATSAERHAATVQAHRRVSAALSCRPCGLWLGVFGSGLLSYRLDERIPPGRQIVEFLPPLPGCEGDVDGWAPLLLADLLAGLPTGGVQ